MGAPPMLRGEDRWWMTFEGFKARDWNLVHEWKTRNRAYIVRRQMREGEYNLPGGVEAWELRIQVVKRKGRDCSQLWAAKYR